VALDPQRSQSCDQDRPCLGRVVGLPTPAWAWSRSDSIGRLGGSIESPGARPESGSGASGADLGRLKTTRYDPATAPSATSSTTSSSRAHLVHPYTRSTTDYHHHDGFNTTAQPRRTTHHAATGPASHSSHDTVENVVTSPIPITPLHLLAWRLHLSFSPTLLLPHPGALLTVETIQAVPSRLCLPP
jgi:hypothetical protein